ncbi:transcriptional regulator [Chlorobium phaeovibrioides]|uniref:Uncharacterized protein n=3 Tax=Chlorobium/Pelodictyon group TaxID=274493 RepID=Q3B1U1_CHLL3|nr:hypothetical protein [Chlorobium phaeovibrioides]ABB24690.1 conserved hypothetical protein [Pelodictyon luteolum DSM 273]NQU45783.1 transcriptional regulator [Chlorobium sp.]KAA6232264.1 transcriptional regulator [Chlorobium phaeovibrioides]MDT9547468.1 transcriptional regulator [Chlorobium phaeovibrioides]MWV54987.1 transcriptional regulator [Chlorobium phaeovibrioides]
MALTKSYRDTLKARVERDPEFRAALFEEAMSAFLNGETGVGKALLKDLVHSTIGFEGLALELKKSSKSLHRMLAPSGNPTIGNFFQMIGAIKRTGDLDLTMKSSPHHRDKVH